MCSEPISSRVVDCVVRLTYAVSVKKVFVLLVLVMPVPKCDWLVGGLFVRLRVEKRLFWM